MVTDPVGFSRHTASVVPLEEKWSHGDAVLYLDTVVDI